MIRSVRIFPPCGASYRGERMGISWSARGDFIKRDDHGVFFRVVFLQRFELFTDTSNRARPHELDKVRNFHWKELEWVFEVL